MDPKGMEQNSQKEKLECTQRLTRVTSRNPAQALPFGRSTRSHFRLALCPPRRPSADHPSMNISTRWVGVRRPFLEATRKSENDADFDPHAVHDGLKVLGAKDLMISQDSFLAKAGAGSL